MVRRVTMVGILIVILLAGFTVWMEAQERDQGGSVLRVVVSLVQLNVAVTDAKGNYVTGLRPSDFEVTEDRIPEKVATFEEGNGTPENLIDPTPKDPQPRSAAAPSAPAPALSGLRDSLLKPGSAVGSPEGPITLDNGASVFILFDTSNYMYRQRGFVFAQDAIAEFVRSLENPYRVAFYSYSRDFFRASPLTADRSAVLRGVRGTVNGDDSALYNALLLTLKDASQYTGRKVVVVFSNGPDNASMVSPEDVDELAQSEGIPIYMISTREARLDTASSTVFGRMSSNTGGEVYFAKSWRDEQQAFSSIREDLAHLYFMSYYPQPNPNRGWRTITVRLVGQQYRKYRIRTRSGYRPIPTRGTVETPPVQ
jgi:Ca-activated chloride channel homolog